MDILDLSSIKKKNLAKKIATAIEQHKQSGVFPEDYESFVGDEKSLKNLQNLLGDTWCHIESLRGDVRRRFFRILDEERGKELSIGDKPVEFDLLERSVSKIRNEVNNHIGRYQQGKNHRDKAFYGLVREIVQLIEHRGIKFKDPREKANGSHNQESELLDPVAVCVCRIFEQALGENTAVAKRHLRQLYESRQGHKSDK